MNQALVSVIMSTYNETKNELKTSINSILNQTYKNIEFIIVNDNPNNKELLDILNSFSDPRIHIVNNETNKGLVYSLNEALKHVHGDYVARMDADDISHIDRIEKQINHLKNNNLDLVGTTINLMNQDGSLTGNTISNPTKSNNVRLVLKHTNCVCHPTWLGKKEVFDKLNGYRDIHNCEDYDFLLRMINQKYKVGNIKEALLDYRVRENSISQSNLAKQNVLSWYISKGNHINLSQEEINCFYNSKQFELETKKCQQILDLVHYKKFSLTIFVNKYFYHFLNYGIIMILERFLK